MSRKNPVLLAVAIFAIAAWYAFRPERAFINQRVNEQFPTNSAAINKLATGQFQSELVTLDTGESKTAGE